MKIKFHTRQDLDRWVGESLINEKGDVDSLAHAIASEILSQMDVVWGKTTSHDVEDTIAFDTYWGLVDQLAPQFCSAP